MHSRMKRAFLIERADRLGLSDFFFHNEALIAIANVVLAFGDLFVNQSIFNRLIC